VTGLFAAADTADQGVTGFFSELLRKVTSPAGRLGLVSGAAVALMPEAAEVSSEQTSFTPQQQQRQPAGEGVFDRSSMEYQPLVTGE
jgi:hypothetical protein